MLVLNLPRHGRRRLYAKFATAPMLDGPVARIESADDIHFRVVAVRREATHEATASSSMKAPWKRSFFQIGKVGSAKSESPFQIHAHPINAGNP